MTKKSNAGRPTVMTESVIEKLREAFLLGCSDLEACLSANIGTTSLYKYFKENPEFANEKDKLKENPVLQARTTVVREIQKDGKLAMDFLRNKKNKEFSTQQQVDHTSKGEKIIPIMGGIAEDITE